MSQYDRVEVMDFLINVLKDHEKSLDTLISRAENVIAENQGHQNLKESGSELLPHKVVLKDWSEFRRRLSDVDLVCFDLIKSVFVVSASVGFKIYEYRETLPTDLFAKDKSHTPTYRLSIGLDLFLKNCLEDEAQGALTQKYEIEPQYTQRWLSKELSIHQDYVVCGDIEL